MTEAKFSRAPAAPSTSAKEQGPLNVLFEKFGIARAQTGNYDADRIEDWTTMLLWLTEKGVRRDQLSKNGNAVMMGILCLVAECLASRAGENKAFCMMMVANAANRAFFAENPMRPSAVYELAKAQRDLFDEYSQWREYVADITGGVDEVFETGDEKARTKIAVAVSGLMKNAWSVLSMGGKVI